jgi:transcriptional regulator with XRE-family HTH domain
MSKTHPLRIWRKAAGKTQAELGAIVGVRGSTISMIESGQRGASLELDLRIAAATDRAVPLECLTRPSQVEAA